VTTYSSTGSMEKQEQELRERAALLMEALGRLPPDAVTLSALFDVAVSAAVAVTFDPSTARLMFEDKMREYECYSGSTSRGVG
jgi:hypothetical protein